MYKVACSVRGISPLLQNRHPFPEEIEKVNKDDRELYDFENAKYKLEDGRLYQPSEHFISAMTKAAVDYRIEGQGKKSYKDSVKSCIFIEQEKITHKIQDYEPYRAYVTIGMASVVKSRPMFKVWELDFDIICVNDQFPPSILEKILTTAGLTKGIGDYRPRFGRFEVTKFETDRTGGK